jgi:hypothetical protein
MLQFLNLLQLLLYIPLLALMGQGLLFVLAGGNHERNFFYQTLRLMSKPFTWVVRRLTPASLSQQQTAFITFALLAALSFWVFAERGYLLCVASGQQGCIQ